MALSVAEWEADLRSLGFGASLRKGQQRRGDPSGGISEVLASELH